MSEERDDRDLVFQFEAPAVSRSETRAFEGSTEVKISDSVVIAVSERDETIRILRERLETANKALGECQRKLTAASGLTSVSKAQAYQQGLREARAAARIEIDSLRRSANSDLAAARRTIRGLTEERDRLQRKQERSEELKQAAVDKARRDALGSCSPGKLAILRATETRAAAMEKAIEARGGVIVYAEDDDEPRVLWPEAGRFRDSAGRWYGVLSET